MENLPDYMVSEVVGFLSPGDLLKLRALNKLFKAKIAGCVGFLRQTNSESIERFKAEGETLRMIEESESINSEVISILASEEMKFTGEDLIRGRKFNEDYALVLTTAIKLAYSQVPASKIKIREFCSRPDFIGKLKSLSPEILAKPRSKKLLEDLFNTCPRVKVSQLMWPEYVLKLYDVLVELSKLKFCKFEALEVLEKQAKFIGRLSMLADETFHIPKSVKKPSEERPVGKLSNSKTVKKWN